MKKKKTETCEGCTYADDGVFCTRTMTEAKVRCEHYEKWKPADLPIDPSKVGDATVECISDKEALEIGTWLYEKFLSIQRRLKVEGKLSKEQTDILLDIEAQFKRMSDAGAPLEAILQVAGKFVYATFMAHMGHAVGLVFVQMLKDRLLKDTDDDDEGNKGGPGFNPRLN